MAGQMVSYTVAWMVDYLVDYWEQKMVVETVGLKAYRVVVQMAVEMACWKAVSRVVQTAQRLVGCWVDH